MSGTGSDVGSDLKTVVRAFKVLNAFTDSFETAMIPDLMRVTGASRATSFRLANTLLRLGLLQKTPAGRFALGPGVMELSAAYIRANPARRRLNELLIDLSQELRATIQLSALIGEGVTVVMSAEGTSRVNAAALLGEELPVYATASGKAIVTSLSAEERAELVDSIVFERYTPRTLGSLSEFDSEIGETVDRGFAINNGEFYEGILSVGVPIDRSILGRPAALVAVVPSPPRSQEEVAPIGARLLEAAASLEL